MKQSELKLSRHDDNERIMRKIRNIAGKYMKMDKMAKTA